MISSQTCPSFDEWMNNSGKPTPLNIIQPPKVIKCCYATMRMSLENTPNEGRHKMSHVVGFHLYETSRRGKATETEGRLMVFRGLGEGKGVKTT